jgi:hypothetical protein
MDRRDGPAQHAAARSAAVVCRPMPRALPLPCFPATARSRPAWPLAPVFFFGCGLAYGVPRK